MKGTEKWGEYGLNLKPTMQCMMPTEMAGLMHDKTYLFFPGQPWYPKLTVNLQPDAEGNQTPNDYIDLIAVIIYNPSPKDAI